MGNMETYKNSKIPKGTFGNDDFNPMDLPVTYRVYDENEKVVGKTTSFNNSVAIGHKLGLKYKTKIVATDKSGNERVIQDGVNSSGNKYADGGGVDYEWTVTIVYPSDNKRSGWSSDEVVDINVLANSYQSAEQKAMDKFKKTHSGKKGRVTSVNSNTHKFLDNAKLSKGSTIKGGGYFTYFDETLGEFVKSGFNSKSLNNLAEANKSNIIDDVLIGETDTNEDDVADMDAKDVADYFGYKTYFNTKPFDKNNPEIVETLEQEYSKYAKGSTIKNKYEHNDFPIMFVEIPFGYGKKQGMLVTKLYNLLKKHNIAIDNSKEWHTKGFGEEYENDENHNIVKFNVNDAPNPKKLTETLWNLPDGEYYVSATKDYKYADGGGVGELKVGDKVELRMGGDSKRGVVVSPPSNGKVSVEVEFTDVLSKRLTKMKMAFPISSIHKLSTMANGGGVETESTLRKRFEGYTDEELQIYNGDNAETLKNWNRKDAIQEAIDAVNEEGEEEEKFTYKDIYTSQGGMTFETEEEVKKFIKRTKPFIRKQLKEGNFVVVFNGKEYYIAEKIKHNQYANGGGVGILEQRIALAKKKSKVAKDGKYFGSEVYLVLQHKTDPEEIFVISQFNYNIDRHNNQWNDYNIVFKTNEYAKGTTIKGFGDTKNLIGKQVKVDFRRGAIGTVIDYDNEWVTVDYPTLGFAEKVNLKTEQVTLVGKFAKGTTVKGGGGEGEFWAVASGRKLMGAFPNKKPKQSQYRLVGTGHGWNIKPYAEVQKEGAKEREFEKWELVKEPTDYYLIVKHDYTSGRETNFYQKPKNKYVNGGNTSIRKQKMETINETRNKELNELKKLILKEETDKVLFLTVEEIEEIQSLIYKTEDRSLSKEERDELFIKAIDGQIKKQINGKTYYTIGYTARNKGRNYSWNQATEILYKLHKMGVDAIICQFIPLFNLSVPKTVHDFSFSVLTSPMLSYNEYTELVGGSESVGEQGDPKNNYYEDGGNTSSGYSYSIGGL